MFATLLAVVALAAGPAAGGSAAPVPPAPVAHAAAVCADYPDQAAAQKAKDTRDADGDGIYCEDLPCPCSTAKGGSAPRVPTVTGLAPAIGALGRSITLHPVPQAAGDGQAQQHD